MVIMVVLARIGTSGASSPPRSLSRNGTKPLPVWGFGFWGVGTRVQPVLNSLNNTPQPRRKH